MAEQTTTGGDMRGRDEDDDPVALARQIDALMAGPTAERPSIIVLGDEAVFGITPAKRTR
jgi:hypothetical protein